MLTDTFEDLLVCKSYLGKESTIMCKRYAENAKMIMRTHEGCHSLNKYLV